MSRVIDPKNFVAVGLPPEDLLEAVARAWAAEGWDVDDLFSRAAAVTEEWTYTPSAPGQDPCVNVRARLRATYEERRRVPLRLLPLERILNPQPDTARVLHGLLEWIARVDLAPQRGEPRPQPPDACGGGLAGVSGAVAGLGGWRGRPCAAEEELGWSGGTEAPRMMSLGAQRSYGRSMPWSMSRTKASGGPPPTGLE